MDWIQTVPQEGDRQFRHMLRYFLFPDLVERMSSNRDRLRVLDAFGIAKPRATRKWTDRQLAEALLELRQTMDKQYGTREQDFYRPPLRDVWQTPEEAPGDGGSEDADAAVDRESDV